MLNVGTNRPAHLRALLNSKPLAVPGAFNAFAGRLIERAGFQVAYVSGAGLSAGRALPDIGLLTMEEVVEEARHIAEAVHIPVIVDADTGFGDIHQVYRTVQELESIGIAGIQLEDQTFPKRCGHLPGKEIISTQAMCQKIVSAVEAKKDSNLLVIARTDARALEGIDGTINRAKAYQDAGADAIFPEALESAKEFESFARAFRDPPLPLIANMTEWGKTPLLSLREFSELGYHMVLYPMTLFRIMAKAMEDALVELQVFGTQEKLLECMQTRTQLYDVLHYEDFNQFEEIVKKRQVPHGDGL